MVGGIAVPTALTGVITKLGSIGICQDGATHLIHTITGGTRLKAKRESIAKALDKVSNGQIRVTVMGDLT
jgi:hypothetical protein